MTHLLTYVTQLHRHTQRYQTELNHLSGWDNIRTVSMLLTATQQAFPQKLFQKPTVWEQKNMGSILYRLKTQSLSVILYFSITAILQTAFKWKQWCAFIIQIVMSQISLPVVKFHSAFTRGEVKRRKRNQLPHCKEISKQPTEEPGEF